MSRRIAYSLTLDMGGALGRLWADWSPHSHSHLLVRRPAGRFWGRWQASLYVDSIFALSTLTNLDLKFW